MELRNRFMSGFATVRDPSSVLCEELAKLTPANPFHTPQYAATRRELGCRLWAFTQRSEGRLVAGCLAFQTGGLLRRTLEIDSIPSNVELESFWKPVIESCRSGGISLLELGTYASQEKTRAPESAYEVRRRSRCEFVLDLTEDDPLAEMSSNHRRNAKKGMKAGLQVRKVTDPQACLDHARLMASSCMRRKGRGESVPDKVDYRKRMAFLKCGSGMLFQAFLAEKPVSSILVLVSEQGAYYESAGTSPEGMAVGASHYLVQEVTRFLKANSFAVFNLGGAGSLEVGLQQFKAGFGAKAFESESAEFNLCGKVRRKLGTAVRLARTQPRQLVKHSLGKVDRYLLYAIDPKEAPPPKAMDNVILKPFADEELVALGTSRSELRDHAERFQRLGYNSAYAVYEGDRLAHVSWLITPDRDRSNPVRNVRLREGEAEITHCTTLPEFRGRGLYVFAIRTLCRLAAQQGIRRIFMITDVLNHTSQRGIERAGLAKSGRVIRWSWRFLPERYSITYRSHRWMNLSPDNKTRTIT